MTNQPELDPKAVKQVAIGLIVGFIVMIIMFASCVSSNKSTDTSIVAPIVETVAPTPIPTPIPTPSIEDNIKAQFSKSDGRHYRLFDYIKSISNDPDSIETVSTSYTCGVNTLHVTTVIRGKNAFGAKILNKVTCDIAINPNGTYLTVNPYTFKLN